MRVRPVGRPWVAARTQTRPTARRNGTFQRASARSGWSPAPAKRGAILWTHDVLNVAPEDFWTEDALEIFDNLVSWAVDGKQGAKVYFMPDPLAFAGDEFMSEHLEGIGYTIDYLLVDDAIPADAELVINTGSAAPVPPSLLANIDVPVIAYNAANHDDLAVSKIGIAEVIDPSEVTVVPENQSHPVLGGKTGTIEWSTEPGTLQGIGQAASGAKVLATYTNPAGVELPAVLVIEQGGGLIGGFSPAPEGAGYWVGGDLNLDFAGFAAVDVDPRVLELNPVNVTGQKDVRLTVALAATDADFEDTDYLRVLIDPTDSGTYQTVAEFIGVNEPGSTDDKAMRDTKSDMVLSPDVFRDISFDIPAGATNLVVRFEAFNTFPNEIIGIDNVRITSGSTVLQAGDADQDLDFDQLDLVKVQIAAKYLTGQAATWGDGDWNRAPGGSQGNPPTGNGRFDQLDIIAALSNGLYLKGPYAAIAPDGQAGTRRRRSSTTRTPASCPLMLRRAST